MRWEMCQALLYNAEMSEQVQVQYALKFEPWEAPMRSTSAGTSFLPVICGYGYWLGNVVWQAEVNAVMLLSMGKAHEFFFQLWHHAWLVCFLHCNTIWWQQIFQLQFSSIHRETVKLPPYDDNTNYPFNHILFCEIIPYQEHCAENKEPMSLQFMNKCMIGLFSVLQHHLMKTNSNCNILQSI